MRYAMLCGFFSIDAMPGQPSIAWCSDFTVFKEFRGSGNAHVLKDYQNKVLKREGFTLAMCSVKRSNEAQIRVLEVAGWKCTMVIDDVRTGEPVTIWSCRISQGS